MLKEQVESLIDLENLVCSSPRHSNDMLYSSINQKLKKNSENSNFSDLLNLVEKSSHKVWNSDKIKNVDWPEWKETNDNEWKESPLDTIEADTR